MLFSLSFHRQESRVQKDEFSQDSCSGYTVLLSCPVSLGEKETLPGSAEPLVFCLRSLACYLTHRRHTFQGSGGRRGSLNISGDPAENGVADSVWFPGTAAVVAFCLDTPGF